MSYIAWVGLITASLSAIMEMMVLLSERKKIINILLSVAFLGMFAIGIAVFFAWLPDQDPHMILALWKIAYIGIIISPAILVHLTAVILGDVVKIPRWVFWLTYAMSIIFQMLNIFGYIINSVVYRSWGYYDAQISSWVGPYFLIFLFGSMIASLFLCIQYYHSISLIQRRQLAFFFLSIFCGALGGAFFYLPDFQISNYIWGTMFLAGYPGLLGYAVLRYQFFDIRSAILRVLRLTMSIVVSLGIFIGCIFYIFGNTPLADLPPLVYVVLYFLSSIFWFSLYKTRWVRSLFIPRDTHILERATTKFLKETLVYDVVGDLEDALKSHFSQFLYNGNLSLYDRISLKKYTSLKHFFETQSAPIFRGSRAYIAYAQDIDAEIIFPLFNNESQVIGILLLGKKHSDKQYTQEDIDLISQILLKLSLSLQVLDHNLDLRIEVLKRTHELTEKNEELARAYRELQEIDANKDTFLAIASHELRTPMTIIKGYSDMLIQGSFGDMTDIQKKYMAQIYQSTEDLIHFVNNILDISKLEAGRMPFTYTICHHHEHIQKVVNNFMTLYAEKSVDLILTDLWKNDTITLDESKLTLILNNLLSNAYKFTPSGGRVEVRISDIVREGEAYLCITLQDSGIGISAEAQEHIFEKFS